jgi:asparagine synthase (glutamine-hydrolysing)
MCGICGVFAFAQRGHYNVEAMVSTMKHRGPDDSGIFQEGGIALGMARLAIIDLTPTGHQPMSNGDGSVWIVYNGETYNFREEREILIKKGHSFKSTSDTEVVLQMYETYGDDFLLRMRGMFALAIYDKRGGPGRERLLLARDHLGIKPLLFARTGGRIIFASEMKALLASGLVVPEIDPVALRLLLTFGSVYQPRTILRGVNMLLPAHRLVVDQNHERMERYWSLSIDCRQDLRKRSYEDLVAEVGDVLKESVSLQLISDVPLGAFLSGGVDSSVLVALMTRVMGQRVKTFSVGFEKEGADIDESKDAQRTAAFLGTEHSHVLVKGEDVRDRIGHIASSLDQPSVDGVNSYFISMAAREGVTVAISGTGGDEVFAGYPWFISMILYEQHKEKEFLRALAESFLASVARLRILDPLVLTRSGFKLQRIRSFAGFMARYAANYQIFDAWGTARLLSSQIRSLAQAGRSERYDLSSIDELPNGSTIERVTGLCLRGYTNNQLLRDIDAVSMAHSLEVRVPYLDPLLIETALSLPDSVKMGEVNQLSTCQRKTYRETGAKRILIDIGRQFLPADFDLQPKRGFGMPFDVWLKGVLREILLESLSENSIKKRGLLDVKEAVAVRERFLEGHLSWARPWLLMMLELWCQEVLDKNGKN